MTAARQRRLEAVVARLQERYGPTAVRKAVAAAATAAPLPTGTAELDAALGGGVPCGRITELAGAATCGKATLAGQIIGQAHRHQGGAGSAGPGEEALAAWLDLPHTCDPDYLQDCGVDLSRLLVVRPQAAADALPIARYLVESHALRVLVIDVSRDLVEATPDQSDGGLQQLALRVTAAPTAVLFLVEPAAASRTLAQAAAVRLALTRVRWLMRGADVCGYEGQILVVKQRGGAAGAVVAWRVPFSARL